MFRNSVLLLVALVAASWASAQTVSELVGHAGPVTGLVPSPDGNRLASVSFDKTIKLWDLNAKTEIKSVTLADPLLAVALHPTLPQIATGSKGKQTLLWNFSAGEPFKQYGPLPIDPGPFARSPDGSKGAIAGADGIVRLIDLLTAQPLGEWKAHEGAIHSVDFSADNMGIVTSGADGTLATWKITGELAERHALGHIPTRARLASPANLFLSVDALGELRATRSPTPAPLAYAGHAGDVVDLLRTPTTLVSLGSDHTIHAHDVLSGAEKKAFAHPGKVTAFTLSPLDENLLITAGEDKLLRAWNLAEGNLLATSVEMPDVIRALAFLPEGKSLAFGEATGALRTIPYPFLVEYNDRAIDAHAAPLVSLARSAKTGYLLTASGDRTIKLWDAAGNGIRAFALFAPIRQAILAETEDRIAAVGADNVLRAWQINGAELKVLSSVTGAIAFSLDGKLLVYAGVENKIHVVPADFSAEPKALAGHAATVQALVVSPAGNVSISGSADGSIKVIDLASGAEVKTLAGHQGSVRALAISADAKTLLSGGEDKTLRLWNLETGTQTAQFNDAAAPVLSVALMPDASAFASATSDNVVRVYRQGALRSTVAGAAPAGLAFGADFKSLIVAQQDAKLRFLAEREPRLVGKHGGAVKQIIITPDGKNLLSASDDTLLRLWDITSAKSPRAFAHSGPVTQMSMSADGATLLSAEGTGKVRSWSLGTGEPGMLASLPAPVVSLSLRGDAGEWSALAGDQLHRGKLDGAMVESTPAPGLSLVTYASGAADLLRGGKEKRLERVPATLVWKAAGATNLVAIEVTPEGKVVTVAGDGNVSARSAATGDMLASFATTPCSAASVDGAGKRLVIIGTDLKPRSYDLATNGLLEELGPLPAACASVDIRADNGELLVALVNGQALTFANGKPTATYQTPAGATSARWLADPRHVIALSADKMLRWFEEPPPVTIPFADQDGSIFDVAYSPDGQKIATAASDGSIFIRDAMNPASPVILRGHQGQVYSIVFSADGQTLASAGADKNVVLWNLGDGKEIKRFMGAEAPLYRVQFLGTDRLVAAGVDRRARVWDIASGNATATLESSEEIYGLAARGDGAKIATSGLGGTVTVWDVATAQGVFSHKLPAPTYAVAYRPSGAELVIAAADNKIYVLTLPDAAK